MTFNTLAVFSPNQNAYSETFIQAHKQLPFQIKYYYGDFLPTTLDESILQPPLWSQRVLNKLRNHFNARELRLLRSLRKERINCVLAEYGPTGCETLRVVKHLGLPLIVHFHGFDASESQTIERYKDLYIELFEYASAVIVVSRKMVADLIGLGCPQAKIIYGVCGPDNQFLSVLPKYAQPFFIAVGRFTYKKAPHLTILAFSRVVKQFPNAKLTMVGEGELLPVAQELVRGLGLHANVEFKGMQTTSQILRLFEQSMAFVQHSVVAYNGDAEGTPVAVLEAQAASLPVIATTHAGIPDVVEHGTTGLLCSEHDVTGMADNMIRLLSSPALCEKLGKNARKRVLDQFTLERHLFILAQTVRTAIQKTYGN
ncbi:MAG TPA: glycosyltransferase [Flavipsychrobacter sp.]|nr:glycosyltransferase [Flavipsychrobacter sp.]